MLKPFYDRDGITIYCGDCREIVPQLGRFDLLLTDPPYGLGDKLDGGSGEWAGLFSDGAPEWDKEITSGFESLVGFSQDSIVWGGNYYDLPAKRGWLVWDKKQDHSSGHAELAWSTLDIPVRCFRLSRVEAYSRMGKVHPTQKPVSLMKWCLRLARNPSSVLDPFMGSGTTLVAAKELGIRAVGIELNERYCEIAVKRLAQGVLDFAGVAD